MLQACYTSLGLRIFCPFDKTGLVAPHGVLPVPVWRSITRYCEEESIAVSALLQGDECTV